MSDIKLYRAKDGSVGTTDVNTAAFGRRSPRRVQRDAVLMYQANRRAGTHSTKTRANITGTTKKPWKQKHTGKARAGTKKSPIWRSGGVAHGPHPRDYSYNVPRKALRAACRAAIAGKFNDGEVVFADAVSFAAPSTKAARGMLAALGVERSCLVVTHRLDVVVHKSMRNLPGVTVMPASDVNAYEVLSHRNLLLTEDSFEALTGRLCEESED